MHWVLTDIGAALVVLMLLDIFHTLWHPSGSGMISAIVGRLMWRLAHVRSRGPGSTVGPLTLVAVLVMWRLLGVVGFALVYWPSMDAGFSFASGLDPGGRTNFADVLYLSLVTFATPRLRRHRPGRKLAALCRTARGPGRLPAADGQHHLGAADLPGPRPGAGRWPCRSSRSSSSRRLPGYPT